MSKAIGQAVRHCREEKGWSQTELASRMGITASAISRKEAGDIVIKPPERKKFAKVFGMSLDKFDQLWRGQQISRSRGGRGIPVINRAPAGVVRDYEEFGVDSGQGFEYIDAESVTDDINIDRLFAVVIVGDSMQDGTRNSIFENDYAVFMTLDPERDRLEPGDVVYVRFTQEANRHGCTIACYYQDANDRVRLQKTNPKYAPIVVPAEHIQQLAKLVEIRRKPSVR